MTPIGTYKLEYPNNISATTLAYKVRSPILHHYAQSLITSILSCPQQYIFIEIPSFVILPIKRSARIHKKQILGTISSTIPFHRLASIQFIPIIKLRFMAKLVQNNLSLKMLKYSSEEVIILVSVSKLYFYKRRFYRMHTHHKPCLHLTSVGTNLSKTHISISFTELSLLMKPEMKQNHFFEHFCCSTDSATNKC